MLLLLSACATTTETHSIWQIKTGESHPAFRHFYVPVPSAPVCPGYGPMWQAQSRSMNPDNLKNGAKGYAKSIVLQLDKDGALKR